MIHRARREEIISLCVDRGHSTYYKFSSTYDMKVEREPLGIEGLTKTKDV